MREPTKAWLVLADDDGPITGLELPNITSCWTSAHDEPILWEMMNSGRFTPHFPMQLEIRLTNLGPFIERTPPPNANDRPRGWKPKTAPAPKSSNPPKEIES